MGNWDGFGSSEQGRRALTAITLFATLIACGGRSFDNDGGGDPAPSPGGMGQGGSGNKAGGATGGSSKGGGNSAGSSQGGSAPDVCEDLDDQPAALVEVVIYNRTAVPIHLGQPMVNCSVSPLFQVHTADGAALPDLGSCRSPCQSLRTGGPAGCPAICAFPSSIRLLPDEMLFTSWDALYQEQGQLPQECAPAGYGGGMCDQARRIQPGVFTFSAQAGLSVDCTQTTGGMCSPCTQNGEGGCTTPGSVIGGMLLFTTSTVEVDTNWATPGSSPPRNPNPAPLPVPRVDLVFTDQ